MIIKKEPNGTFTYSGAENMAIDYIASALNIRWDLNVTVWKVKLEFSILNFSYEYIHVTDENIETYGFEEANYHPVVIGVTLNQ